MRKEETEGLEGQEGQEGLTRSQIRNRKKKEKKLKEAPVSENGTNVLEEKEKENGENVQTNGTEHSKEKKSTTPTQKAKLNGTKVNGISEPKALSSSTMPPPSSSTKPDSVPSTNDNTSISEPATSNPVPPKPNGIKSSPSHRASQSRSPSVVASTHSTEATARVPSPTSVTELRARLAERIAKARVARKAVGSSVPGAPQTREAILKARAVRKARVEEKIRQKKETQKALERNDKDGVKEEEGSSDDEIVESGLTFGRVNVADAEVDAGKGEIKMGKKKKGASDPKGLLNHLLAKQERLDKMDPEKKAKAVENDRWHHALLAAKGEKVRHDVGLLKKTIARKDREKKKSTKDWGERLARVEKSKDDRQRKREENLAKRRDEKGKKGKKAVKSGKKPVVKKKRPGFEGGRVKIGKK